jgi:drug/metabolite transporter (DMT)-like permease
MITVSHGRETFVLVVMQAMALRVVVSGSMCYRLRVPTTLLIIAVTLNAVLGQLMLKYAVIGLGGSAALSNLPAFMLSAAKSPLVYVSIAIQGFGYLLWMMLIARMKLGLASASVGAGFYVCMALAAWGVYGESLSRLQWLGLGLITLGVSCIGLASAS